MTKILIVDESPDVRALLEEALERGRVEILAASSGAQALERIERDRPDLVVCDVYMPDMDGYRICDFVRAHPQLKAAPVLLMADIVDRAALARGARVGADDVVRKPCSAHELLNRIDSFLPGLAAQPAIEPRDLEPNLDAPADPQALLTTLAELPGVSFAALTDREGFVIEWAGGTALDPEMVAALVSSVGESSEGVGRELGQGALQNMICEYDEGLVLLMDAGSTSRLAVVLREPSALEAARRCAKQMAPALLQAL
jgi:CheY-like chemotaxis protein/predicted regulator of Ras-like GTPase activity (Roadblock/LC7/MglB family)